ncbi:MAG: ABC transporter ATP-binding protein [Candidatus Margulisiibacteriota bacterium]|jgi:ABC-type multidrug transport system fused ATPase/permease subunit
MLKSLINEETTLFFRFFTKTLIYLDKIVLSLFIAILSQVFILIPPLFIKVIFDYAYYYQDFSILLIFMLLGVFIGFSVLLFNLLNSFINLYLDQETSKIYYKLLYAKFQVLPMKFYQEFQTGDLVYRMSSDINEAVDTVLNSTKSTISTLCKLGALLFIALQMNAGLTLLALLGVPLQFLQTHYFAKKMQAIAQKNKEVSASIYGIIIEKISNIKLIKMFAQGDKEIAKFIHKTDELFEVEQKNLFVSNLNTFSSSNINTIWTTALAIYTGFLVINGQLSIGEAIAISTYIALLSDPFNTLAALYRQLITAKSAFNRIVEVLDYEEENLQKGTIKDVELKGCVTFKNVNFGYTPNKLIIKNLNLTIPELSSFAFVGKSGIGKSSLIDLLLRFYNLDSGQILIDNYDITDLDLLFLRRHIALIPQDIGLLDGTIRENITFGVNEKISDDEVITYAKKADAHEFIIKLPLGYNTLVGKKGISLSGGQKQRIAIARALITKPRIIIFDEATSALDSESEKYIHVTIENLQKELTIIIIAHRLSTIKHVNNIVVLGQEGEILETGSYFELINKRGYFYRLHELQFGGFQEFLHELYILLKTSMRYQRNLSVTKFKIQRFNLLQKNISEQELVNFLEDLVMTIALSIREVDLVSYQMDGSIWLALPETSFAGAEIVISRIKNSIESLYFPEPYNFPIKIETTLKELKQEEDLTILLRKEDINV